MLTGLSVIIIPQYIQVLNHYLAQLKLVSDVSYTSAATTKEYLVHA